MYDLVVIGGLSMTGPIVLCLALSGLLAQEVALAPRWKPGAVLLVDEESRIDTKVKATVRGVLGDPTSKTSGTGKYVERKARSYRQEVTDATDDAYALAREYSNSIKETMKPSGKKLSSERTLLHGRKVVIARKGAHQEVKSDTGPVEGDDSGDATFVDQVYALLPRRFVKVGDTWDVDPTSLGEAIFHEGYNPAIMKLEGKGMLKSVSGKEGERVAKLALAWSLTLEKTGPMPGIKYCLTGTARFHLDKGQFLALEAGGPIELDITEGQNTMELEGRMTISYKARDGE